MNGNLAATGRSIRWLGAFVVFLPLAAAAADRLDVTIDGTHVLDLDRPASVVSVANPKIADVNVQSPKVIIVTGKAMGTTSLDVLDARKNRIASYEVVVTPDTKDQVTINHGADAIKTLSCQPRCVRVGNPGKDPEPSGGGGIGGAAKKGGAAGGGALSQLGGAAKGAKK